MAPIRGFAALCCFPAVLAFTGEDHSAWVQQQVSVHKDATRPKPHGAELKRVREKPTPKPKMTAEERSQGPLTKKALNSNLQVILKALKVPPLVRGTVSTSILDEVMTARKTMPAQSRAILDHVFTIDLAQLADMAEMGDRFTAIANGLKEAGLEKPAELLETVVPFQKVTHYLTHRNMTNLNFQTVPTMIRDLSAMVPQMKPFLAYAKDVANLMEGNYEKHLTAEQVMKEFPMESNAEVMQLFGDYMYFLRDVISQQPHRAADVGELLRDLKMKPLGDYVQDMPSLQGAGLTELTQRTARLIDEMELMNSSQLDDTFDGIDAAARDATFQRKNVEDWSDSYLQELEDGAKEMMRSALEFFNQTSMTAEEGLNNFTHQSQEVSKSLGNTSKVVWNLMHDAATSTVSTLNSKLKEAVVELRTLAKYVLTKVIFVTRWMWCHIDGLKEEQCGSILKENPSVLHLLDGFELPSIPVTMSLSGIVEENAATLWASIEEALENNQWTAGFMDKEPTSEDVGNDVEQKKLEKAVDEAEAVIAEEPEEENLDYSKKL